jgi:ABC-type multidrug transport system ATPase subunit
MMQTEYLSWHFGLIRAASDLSLEFPSGTVFGFLGPPELARPLRSVCS